MSGVRWGSGRAGQRARQAVRQVYGSVCIYCGCRIPPDGSRVVRDDPGLKLSAAHLTPRSAGGSDDLSNLRPSHLRCNQQAGATPVVVAEHGAAFFKRRS